MTWFDSRGTNPIGAMGNAIGSMRKTLGAVLGKVYKIVLKGIPTSEIGLEEIKTDVWRDLSSIYYKYELEEQKKAFREIMNEISGKINEDRWDSVYNKLYRTEQKRVFN